jgi:hypothetical protein
VREEKKKERAIAPILSTRGTNESIQEKREIPRSSLGGGGGDAVGPTGSPGGPSVSFGALVARPRVYRIEDLRRFSESFVHPRTGSRGFSRALGTTTQCTAWQPGPRAAHSLHRPRRMERVDAVLACLRERTRKRARSPPNVRPSACFGTHTRHLHPPPARAAHGPLVSRRPASPDRVRGVISPLGVLRSVARVCHERDTQQRRLQVRERNRHDPRRH